MHNYYKLLNIATTASPKTIQRSYHKMAKICHPDKNGNTDIAKRQFQLIHQAFETLSDPIKRTQYDYLLIHKHQYFDFLKEYNPALYALCEQQECQFLYKLFNYFFSSSLPSSPSSSPTSSSSPFSSPFSQFSPFQYNFEENIIVHVEITSQDLDDNIIKKIDLQCYVFDRCEQHTSSFPSHTTTTAVLCQKSFLFPSECNYIIYEQEGDCCTSCKSTNSVLLFKQVIKH